MSVVDDSSQKERSFDRQRVVTGELYAALRSGGDRHVLINNQGLGRKTGKPDYASCENRLERFHSYATFLN